jgi:peptide-methionine (S)-S-oxide reductase
MTLTPTSTTTPPAYDCSEETFEKLCKYFFSFHDPTTIDQQGNDRGSQYGSVIFTYDARQAEIANAVKQEVQGMIDSNVITNYAGPAVVTAVVPATTFYPAEDEHQEYLAKNPGGYCNHYERFQWNWEKQDCATSKL